MHHLIVSLHGDITLFILHTFYFSSQMALTG